MSRAALSCVKRAQREILPLNLSLYHAARDYPGGAKAIAAIYGRNPTTLQHKLSPTHPTHQPNPEEIEEVTASTRDPRIIDSMIEAYGDAAWVDLRGIVEEISRECGHELESATAILKAISETLQRQSLLTRTIAEHLANDGVIDHRELSEQRLLLRRAQGALLALERLLEQEAEVDRG
ncbi:hypothetical protein D9M71_279630 [compost metagenome]